MVTPSISVSGTSTQSDLTAVEKKRKYWHDLEKFSPGLPRYFFGYISDKKFASRYPELTEILSDPVFSTPVSESTPRYAFESDLKNVLDSSSYHLLRIPFILSKHVFQWLFLQAAQSLRKHPIKSSMYYLIIAGLIGINVYGLFSSVKEFSLPAEKEAKLYAAVYRLADVNKDMDVSEAEWVRMYHKIGLSYDARKPAELTIKNLEDMLKK